MSEHKSNPFARWKQEDSVSPMQAYDRFGRLLQVGDVVHILNKHDIMWRVSSVKPVLDPTAPPGLIEIGLTAAFVSGAQGGTPLGDLLKVKDASEFPARQES